jgi:hypothetical protein
MVLRHIWKVIERGVACCKVSRTDVLLGSENADTLAAEWPEGREEGEDVSEGAVEGRII